MDNVSYILLFCTCTLLTKGSQWDTIDTGRVQEEVYLRMHNRKCICTIILYIHNQFQLTCRLLPLIIPF